jgi:hypothetical protein
MFSRLHAQGQITAFIDAFIHSEYTITNRINIAYGIYKDEYLKMADKVSKDKQPKLDSFVSQTPKPSNKRDQPEGR